MKKTMLFNDLDYFDTPTGSQSMTTTNINVMQILSKCVRISIMD